MSTPIIIDASGLSESRLVDLIRQVKSGNRVITLINVGAKSLIEKAMEVIRNDIKHSHMPSVLDIEPRQ